MNVGAGRPTGAKPRKGCKDTLKKLARLAKRAVQRGAAFLKFVADRVYDGPGVALDDRESMANRRMKRLLFELCKAR